VRYLQQADAPHNYYSGGNNAEGGNSGVTAGFQTEIAFAFAAIHPPTSASSFKCSLIWGITASAMMHTKCGL
jgi:hypothetical protein